MNNLLLYLSVIVITIAIVRLFFRRKESFTEMNAVTHAILNSDCKNTTFYKANLADSHFLNDKMYIKALHKKGELHDNKCTSSDNGYSTELQCPKVNCIRTDDSSYINTGIAELDIIGDGMSHDNEPKCKYDNCKGYCENVNDLCYKFDSTENKFIQSRGRSGCVPDTLNTESCIIQPTSDFCEDKYVFKFDDNSILQSIPMEKTLSSDFQCMYSSNNIEVPHYLDMTTAKEVCSNIPETSLCYYKKLGIKNQQGIQSNPNSLYYIKRTQIIKTKL